MKNGKNGKQSHAAIFIGKSTPLLGENTAGNGVPIPSRKGKAAMQNARRD